MSRLPVWLVVTVVLGASCSAAAERLDFPAPKLVRREGALWIKGEIGPRFVTSVTSAVRPGDRVNIESRGGERRSGRAVGDVVKNSNLTVRANGMCLSACASYVWLSAERKDGSGWLLFHNSEWLWKELLTRRPELFTEPEKTILESEIAAGEAFFAARGVNPDLFRCMDRALEPDFARAARRPMPAWSDADVLIPVKYQYAWVSRSVLEHYGVKGIEAYWEIEQPAIDGAPEFPGFSVVAIRTPEQCEALLADAP